MSEPFVSHQSILDATELAFRGTDYKLYDPGMLTRNDYDVLTLMARSRTAYDSATDSTVDVHELLADVIEDEYYTDHRLGLEWAGGETIEFSLNTGLLVGDPGTAALLEETEKNKPKILRVLTILMSDMT